MAQDLSACEQLVHPSKRSSSGTSPSGLIAVNSHPVDTKSRIISPITPASGHALSEDNTPRSPHRSPTSSTWGNKYLLTFDGGGVRGYSSLLILKELMHIVGELERAANAAITSSYHPRPYSAPTGTHGPPDDARWLSFRYLPCHYFDYCAGTSTGGLIAIMLGRLRMTVDDCIKEFETLGDKIFGESRWFSVRGPFPALRDKYNGEKLAKVVRDVVRKYTPGSKDIQGPFASDPRMCRTMVLAFRKNPGEEKSPYLFRSYDHYALEEFEPYELNPGKAHTVPIWMVARATSAAPTYFDPISIDDNSFVDGGFGANNPTGTAFFEIVHLHNDENAVALTVSIGTGESGPMSRFGEGVFGKYWAYWHFAKKMASDSHQVHRNVHLHTNGGRRYPYYRFNVQEGLGNMKMDEWKNKNWARIPQSRNKTLAHIRSVTRAYLDQEEIQCKLRETAKILVRNRQIRSQSSMWAAASSGERWRCQCTPCPSYDNPFDSDNGLRHHLAECHAEQGFSPYWENMTAEQIQKLNDMVERGRLPP